MRRMTFILKERGSSRWVARRLSTLINQGYGPEIQFAADVIRKASPNPDPDDSSFAALCSSPLMRCGNFLGVKVLKNLLYSFLECAVPSVSCRAVFFLYSAKGPAFRRPTIER